MSIVSLMPGSSLLEAIPFYTGELISAAQNLNILKVFGIAIIGVASTFELYKLSQGQSLVGRAWVSATTPLSDESKNTYLAAIILLLLILFACIISPFYKSEE